MPILVNFSGRYSMCFIIIGIRDNKIVGRNSIFNRYICKGTIFIAYFLRVANNGFSHTESK